MHRAVRFALIALGVCAVLVTAILAFAGAAHGSTGEAPVASHSVVGVAIASGALLILVGFVLLLAFGRRIVRRD